MNVISVQAVKERDQTLDMIKDHFGRYVEKRARADMDSQVIGTGSFRAARERDFVKQRLRDLCRWSPGGRFQ